tara:strand:- start:309 stop:419 length:111 start_codon:yes stop_codon:yes gene_type:complete
VYQKLNSFRRINGKMDDMTLFDIVSVSKTYEKKGRG